MFEIDKNNLPFVRTRQALLVLDLQNDFVSTGCLLPVDSPPNFLENIFSLVPQIRASGNVIWIRSLFESSRPVNSLRGDTENVITDDEVPASHPEKDKPLKVLPAPSHRLLERHGKITEGTERDSDTNAQSVSDSDEEDSLNETFLTVEPGQTPRLVLAASPGANFTTAIAGAIDLHKDLVFQKTYYSAFKDGRLVQTLRAKFVTEIYLCGVLTNVSVFATAMDAARHGYAITIVEDCLGYRSKARHDEALRRLEEFTGCDMVTSAELIKDLERQREPHKPPPRRNIRPQRKGSGLEALMANLKVSSNASTAPESNAAQTGSTVSLAAEKSVRGPELLLSSESPQDMSHRKKAPEPEGKKRERVQTKIKTRRRRSRSGQNDMVEAVGPRGSSNLGRDSTSTPSATLEAASQALEKFSKAVEGEIPERSAMSAESPTTSDRIEPEGPESNCEGKETGECSDDVDDGDAIASSPEYGSQQEIRAPIDVSPVALCEGDTSIINNLLDGKLLEGIFGRIRDEVRWQKMSHQGGDVPRLVAVQGEIGDDGTIPVYRHPADESPPLLPFSPTVSLIRAKVEKKLGHSVNHVLIQFYRDGTDYISEHSDKTLDIVPSTFIANVSLGAQRTMVFRTKKPPTTNNDLDEPKKPKQREVHRAPLPHNSMVMMGLATNMRWLHAIRQDKRMKSEKSQEELAYDGSRISLTFRLIGTFLDKDEQKIWGQGATAKNKGDAKAVINGDDPESEKMIRAFGKENRASEFDWEEIYGEGFDVLHISNHPKLFLSGAKGPDLGVMILLAEYGISWTEGKVSPAFYWNDGNPSKDESHVSSSLPVKFVDNDPNKSTVEGSEAILLYVDAVYGPKTGLERSKADLARQFTRFHLCNDLREKFRADPPTMKRLQHELERWDAFAAEMPFITGPRMTLVDCMFWPMLDAMRPEWIPSLNNLRRYYHQLKSRDSVIKALGHDGDSDDAATTMPLQNE